MTASLMLLFLSHPIYNSSARHDSSASEVHPQPDCSSTTSTLSHHHLFPELFNSLLTGPPASTLNSLELVFCLRSESPPKNSINCSFLAFNSSRPSMKTITTAYNAQPHWAPAYSSSHSFCCPLSLYPLLTALQPHGPLFSLYMPGCSRLRFCIHCSLAEVLSSNSHSASFFPSFTCHSFKCHLSSWHSLSSHLPIFSLLALIC